MPGSFGFIIVRDISHKFFNRLDLTFFSLMKKNQEITNGRIAFGCPFSHPLLGAYLAAGSVLNKK